MEIKNDWGSNLSWTLFSLLPVYAMNQCHPAIRHSQVSLKLPAAFILLDAWQQVYSKCHYWVSGRGGNLNGTLFVLQKLCIWHTNKDTVEIARVGNFRASHQSSSPSTSLFGYKNKSLGGGHWATNDCTDTGKKSTVLDATWTTVLKSAQASTFHCWYAWQPCSGKRPFSLKLLLFGWQVVGIIIFLFTKPHESLEGREGGQSLRSKPNRYFWAATDRCNLCDLDFYLPKMEIN